MNELNIIKSFKQKKILLIGDTILDVYVYGRSVGKSLDAPNIEAEQDNVCISFGGASLVARNILELGGSLIFFSVVGNDENAKHYDSFNHPKLEKHFLIDKNRRTTVKKRFWIDNYKLFQINEVDHQEIDVALEKKFMKLIESYVDKVDLMLMYDPQHGLLTKNLINHLIKLSKKHGKPLYVDSQVSHRGSNHYLYKGVDCIFFNENEAMTVNPNLDFKKPKILLSSLKQQFEISNIVVKLGPRGSLALFDNKYIKTPAYPVKTIDVCGAGDAFLAAFILGNRKLLKESFSIANKWAGLSTAICGTIPPKKRDLIRAVNKTLRSLKG